MTANFTMPDSILGTKDLDDEFITEAWLVDQFVGNTLFSFGVNNFGQLGNNNITYYSSPIQIGSLTSWKQISCGYNHTSAIKTDGTLWTWGRNTNGELGNNTITFYSSPIQVGSLTNWKYVRNGGYHTTAIKTDGTLWAWGYNLYGQLGNNTRTSYSSPIQIGSLTTWKQLAGGLYFTTAIKTDGTLWTWGQNLYGQLGNNNVLSYSSPIQVGSLTNWAHIYAGSQHTAAIKTDGTLWGCGDNTYGQIANNGNTTDSYSSPIQIGSLTNWKQVAGGNNHTMAVKTDGTLWAWGNNSNGRLGNNTIIPYSSPIQIGSLTSWKYVGEVIANTSMMIQTDGTLWGCGNGTAGQLGNNSIANFSSPIQIGSLTNWKQVVGGSAFTVGITFADIT